MRQPSTVRVFVFAAVGIMLTAAIGVLYLVVVLHLAYLTGLSIPEVVFWSIFLTAAITIGWAIFCYLMDASLYIKN